jgi:AraC-like DNA-binding protein
MAHFDLPRVSSKSTPLPSTRARVAVAGVVSESVCRAPDARLAGIVAGEYQGWSESSTGVVRRREVPSCAIPLIINFGETFRLFDPSRPSVGPRSIGTFVAGMYDSFVVVESCGESRAIQVNFTPIGARLFLQVPLRELANRTLSLDDLFGDRASRVVDALAEAVDWDARFDSLEALIASRVGAAKPTRGEIRWAWERMSETSGRIEIGGLARELGWSHKHLISQFRDHLGAPPKRMARILRFQQSIERIGARAHPRWVELAADCGYFDQSHMIREFRELAGCSPEEFVGLQLPYGGISAGPATGPVISR